MTDVFKQHGAFSWCELVTSDLAAAKAFYTELFGWGMQDMAMEGTPYTVLKAGETEVGGMMVAPPGAGETPPHWGCYVTVDDVEACAAGAARLGGQVLVPPTEIPDVGRFCVIQDPQGAVISAIAYRMG
jgi:predicted enzyme related to lactoylglutathione lyase